jgi:hypothetical protein
MTEAGSLNGAMALSAGENVRRLVVPRRADAGKYRLTIVVRELDGQDEEVLARTLRLRL